MVHVLWMSSRVRLGWDQPLLPPEGEKARVGGQCLGTFSTEQCRSREAPAYLAGCPQRSTTIHFVVGPISLASKAGRTRPPAIFGSPEPVVLIFVTANFEPRTNFLPEIRVGRVVAS